MTLLWIFFCILFHIMFDEAAAERVDDFISSFMDCGMDYYVKDMFVSGLLAKTINEIDWLETAKKVDSMVRSDPDNRMMFIDDENSHN